MSDGVVVAPVVVAPVVVAPVVVAPVVVAPVVEAPVVEDPAASARGEVAPRATATATQSARITTTRAAPSQRG